MIWLQHAVAGLAAGSIFALAGMGLVLTYRATGIFNFAHGVVSVVAAYAYYQTRVEWQWPLWISAIVAIVVVGPAIGLLLERGVFRPLHRQGASTTEKLVATVGVFIMLLGIIFFIWSPTVRTPAPLFSRASFPVVGTVRMSYDQVANILIALAASAAVWILFRRTHLGTEIRAVVDRPLLAEQASVNANRVAAISWAMGTGFAGLAGVLITSTQGSLDPYNLTLFLFDVFAVAVLARLTSVPLAVGAGIFVLGIGQALIRQVTLFGGTGLLGETWTELKPRFPVIVLLLALLVYRKLDVVGDETSSPRRIGGRRHVAHPGVVGLVGALAFVGMPIFLNDINMIYATRMIAIAVIFVSIVAITGFSGHITLGQAALAGFGAFIAARVANSWGVPVALSTVFGGVAAIGLGFIAGWPALRRRGLFLGLTTLALGLLVDKFVFQSPVFAGGINGLRVVRPSLFGVDFESNYAFYYYELAWLGLMLLLARNLRSGRLGRALAAMRDSEAGARSIGIDLRNYKLFIFGASAFIAGIGGSLLAQQTRQFQYLAFNPINSLIWFAVVVVAGVGSVTGALLGAFIFIMLDVVIELDGLSELVIGVAALSLGRLPGGSIVGLLGHVYDRFTSGARGILADARRGAADPLPAAPDLTALRPGLRATMAAAMAEGNGATADTGNGNGNGSGRAATFRPSERAKEVLGDRLPAVDDRPVKVAEPPPGPRFEPSARAKEILARRRPGRLR
ncbi:MAG TPA: ABC transporter permease [Acidimicrobiia bacterium]|nr:ABC transporter permease [Acidimicrobiia bacterium]